MEGWGTEGAELGEYRTLQKGNQRTDIATHELRPHPGSSCLEHSISDFKKKNMRVTVAHCETQFGILGVYLGLWKHYNYRIENNNNNNKNGMLWLVNRIKQMG